LKSLGKLKGACPMYSKRIQRHLFARENREKVFFFVTAHPSSHKSFGACEKGTTATLEGHHTNTIHLTTLFRFEWNDHNASFRGNLRRPSR